MKKIILISALALSTICFSQTPQSRSTLMTDPYKWNQRIVPPLAEMNNTFASFWNTVSDGTPLLATSASTLYVPKTLILTINGVPFNLSANRSWTVGDVLAANSYSNPSFIASLAWAKISGTPTTLAGYGITDAVNTGSAYVNPSWITSLPWSKITSPPTTLSGYGITDAITSASAAATYVPFTGAASNININNKIFTINATATGNGFLELTRTGLAGPNAGLANTLRIGSTSTGQLVWNTQNAGLTDGFRRAFAGTLTGHHNYTLQDADGTLAFTSQIPSFSITTDVVAIGTGTGVTNSAFKSFSNGLGGKSLIPTTNLGDANLGDPTGVWESLYIDEVIDYTSDLSFKNAGSTRVAFKTTGQVGIGVALASITADLHLKAGTTSAGTGPLKLTVSGSSLVTTPETGLVETDANGALYWTPSATRYQLATVITNTATLNFPSTAASTSSDLTFTLTGAVVGDAIVLGIPNASVPTAGTNGSFWAWVSSANTVTVRFMNGNALAAFDPPSGTFKGTIIKN